MGFPNMPGIHCSQKSCDVINVQKAIAIKGDTVWLTQTKPNGTLTRNSATISSNRVRVFKHHEEVKVRVGGWPSKSSWVPIEVLTTYSQGLLPFREKLLHSASVMRNL